MKRALAVAILFMSALFPTSAQAAWLQYQSGPADSYNRPDLPAEYDITRTDFAVSDTNPDEYWFFLSFSKNVTANLFADGLNSWAGVFIDTNNDGQLDYSLETDSSIYVGNYYHAGRFEDRTSGQPILSSKCTVQTWTNLTTSVNWIGFSIKKTCLPLGSTIGIQGYSDHIPNDNAQYDYAPDSIWTLNLTGGAVTPSGNSASTTITGQLPSVNLAGESQINAPSNQPSDLVSLASQTTKSVVTVLCGDSLGSGWAINADLSAANVSNGYKSYVITNHHVIANCTTNRNITLVLSDQSRVPAYVYSWDEANDVAGILTGTLIPPLNWRGATPQQGWWVGIIGSPLGFPGILTAGIVSSVNSSTYLGTTNAAINPGNSGGPVFDRTGRVIGLATAKYVNSEGFGIFHGTPLLCQKIVVCTGTSQIWTGSTNSVASPTPTLTPSPTITPLIKKSDQYITYVGELPDSAISKISIPFSATTNSGLSLTYNSVNSNVCAFEMNKIILFQVGLCVITIDQAGNESWNPASTTVVRFNVLSAPAQNKILAKVTQPDSSWAAIIDSYQVVSGPTTLSPTKLSTIQFDGHCTSFGKKVQMWKNTDSTGKRYSNGSKPAGLALVCKGGIFSGRTQVNGNTRIYLVELPSSHNGTMIEFRVGQVVESKEYLN